MSVRNVAYYKIMALSAAYTVGMNCRLRSSESRERERIMATVTANGIQIEYETFGNPASKPLLLIMGLGGQMITWDEEFCIQLLQHGFYVIRFDNRDVGLSTKFEDAGIPDITVIIHAIQAGKAFEIPYSLEDMVDDAVGLLDALHIKRVHVCGVSMGAYIAQIIAFRHPSRVFSLTSIMGSTGNPQLPPPTPAAMRILLTPMPTERGAYIEQSIKDWRILYGSRFPFDEDE